MSKKKKFEYSCSPLPASDIITKCCSGEQYHRTTSIKLKEGKAYDQDDNYLGEYKIDGDLLTIGQGNSGTIKITLY